MEFACGNLQGKVCSCLSRLWILERQTSYLGENLASTGLAAPWWLWFVQGALTSLSGQNLPFCLGPSSQGKSRARGTCRSSSPAGAPRGCNIALGRRVIPFFPLNPSRPGAGAALIKVCWPPPHLCSCPIRPSFSVCAFLLRSRSYYLRPLLNCHPVPGRKWRVGRFCLQRKPDTACQYTHALMRT